jgi:ubiquinone/menaquinone biosynthesis C-methylase UbiE
MVSDQQNDATRISRIWNSVWISKFYRDPKRRSAHTQRKLTRLFELGLQFPPNVYILDIGCGTGTVLGNLVNRCSLHGYGVDICDAALAQARARFQNHSNSLSFIMGDVNALPFANSIFDLVIAFGIVEHVDNPEEAIRECYRMVRTGGICAFSQSHKRSFGPVQRRLSTLMRLWPYGRQCEFTIKEFERMLRNAGFKNIRFAVGRACSDMALIHILDSLLGLFLSDWGFYLLATARK